MYHAEPPPVVTLQTADTVSILMTGAIYMTYSVGLRRYIDNPKIVSKIEPLSEAAERPRAGEFRRRGNSSHISQNDFIATRS